MKRQFSVEKIENIFFEIEDGILFLKTKKLLDYLLIPTTKFRKILNIISNNDMKKIMIFDYRIKDQLILK